VTPSNGDNHHRDADREHGKRQELAPGEGANVEPQLSIRLTNEFDQKAEQSVKSQQRPKHRSAMEILLVDPPQHYK